MNEAIDGMIVYDKPRGISSFGCVRAVRTALDVRKAGHCGTLDPLAEGVLLIVVGKATRLQDALMGMKKVYTACIQMGITTDSGDSAGVVTGRFPVPDLKPEQIEKVLARFRGEIEQIPPMFSALKRNGQPLYKLARAGVTVERAPRRVTIYSLTQTGLEGTRLSIRVECSRGTYIRTLAEDVGAALGCGAMVERLARDAVGQYGRAQAVRGDRPSREELMTALIPLERLREGACHA